MVADWRASCVWCASNDLSQIQNAPEPSMLAGKRANPAIVIAAFAILVVSLVIVFGMRHMESVRPAAPPAMKTR